MTLKKSFVKLCIVCCALFGMAQSASAQSILLLHETAGNGDRFVGDYWGQYGGEAYISATEDFLIESFGAVATIDSYNISDDPLGLNDDNILTSTTEKLAILNSYDLIIVDTSVGSGTLRDQPYIYNSLVTTPLIAWKTFLTRSDRWGWHAQGSPGDNAGTTVTETISLTDGGSVRLYKAGPYDDLSLETIWFPGNTDNPSTLTQLSTRFYTNVSTSATIVASWPGTESYAIARWDNVGVPFYDGSSSTPGGPRMQFVFPDDRNEIPYEVTGLAVGQHKAFNPNEVLSDEGKAYLKNLIVDFAPALAPERKILVVGAESESTNGGRHFGRFWGKDGREHYESDTVRLMEEYFAPTASVDFYEISESDYMDLQGMTTTTDTQVAFLNDYDLIIVGHSCPTNTIANDTTRSGAWNELVTKPVVLMAQFALGNNSNRWSWINTGSIGDNAGTTPTEVLVVNNSSHPAFDNVDVSGGTLRLFNEAPYTPSNAWYSNSSTDSGLDHFGQRSHIHDMADNSGDRIAEFQGYTNYVNIVVWDAGTPFYTGGPYTPAGTRALLNINDNRNQLDPALGFGNKAYSCIGELTPEGKQMIKDLLVSMSSVPLPVELGSFELE